MLEFNKLRIDNLVKKMAVKDKKGEKPGQLRLRGYRQVSLPIKLVERIDVYIKENPQEGFTSVPEFIRQSIREKLFTLDNGKKDNM